MKRLVALWTMTSLLGLGSAREQEKKTDASDDATIIGQIVPNDLRDKRRNHPCKIHTFKLSKDKTYIIDMESRDFDSYLRIEDVTGKQLAEDDDSGGNLNARIRFLPPQDAVYQIIAMTFAGGAGTYTLKVHAEGRK
jgi:hypothetical protein